MSKRVFLSVIVILSISIIIIEPALAGPGGKIAKAAFESLWGRIILAGLVIFFLPLITYVLIREKISERRARRDLAYLAVHSSKFDWLKLQERAKDCFYRVHSGWEREDLSGVSNWMTDWYWQNQQLVHLDRWRNNWLKNVCEVKRLTGIKPILFVHRNEGGEHENSVVVISMEANMKDYLEDVKSGSVVEGSKRYKDVETVWSFTMENGEWKVSDIEEGSMSLAYAKLAKDLPRIESTLISREKA